MPEPIVLFEDMPHSRRGGPLSAEGVTVERMAAFATAAARFAAAEPWRHLGEDDVIQVEAPEVASEVRFVSLMGQTGEQRGLLFCSGRELFLQPDVERLEEVLLEEGLWLIAFDPASEVPAEDRDLWESHGFDGLALAGESVYAVAARMGGPGNLVRRPDARLLAFFEGLLGALASTTEDEMDAGRWEREVATFGGPVRFVLSLPGVLDPPDPSGIPIMSEETLERALAEIERRCEEQGEVSAQEVEAILLRARGGDDSLPRTDEERARRLASEALAASGRRQLALARQALKLWPDCAEAYLVLAGRETDPERTREVYALGVAGAERTLGPDALRDHAGHLWLRLEARPYLRARYGLAEALSDTGAHEEAAGHFRELLRLDPDDHQDVHHRLARTLLLLRRDDELARLLDEFHDDSGTEWAYTHALLAFRREGDSTATRSCLTLAVRRNRFVPRYLLLQATLPPVPLLFIEPGSELEAIDYAFSSAEVWAGTPGALAWLDERTPVRSKRKKTRKRGRKRRR